MILQTSQRGKISLRFNQLYSRILQEKKTLRKSLCDFSHVNGIVPSRKRNHSGDLQKTHLQSIRGTDLHTIYEM